MRRYDALMESPLSHEDIKNLMPGPGTHVIETEGVRDLGPEVLDPYGRPRVLSAAWWASTTVQERALFGHRNGIYCFPTIELVERLKQIIDGRAAIEIGSGNGVLAEALGIPGSDNFQQEMPKYKFIYAATRQPTVKYGPNVWNMHASQAVRHWKPQVVIGAWITQKFNPARPELGGNEIGVDLRDIRLQCEQLVLIGNEKTHDSNPLWTMKHEIDYPDYLYSRAANGSREFIATWKGGKSPLKAARP